MKKLPLILSGVAVVIALAAMAVSIKVNRKVNALHAVPVIDAGEVINAGNNVDETDAETIAKLENLLKEAEEITKQVEEAVEEAEETVEENNEENQDENTEENQESQPEEPKYVFSISEEERVARKAKQQEIKATLDFLYAQPHSLENSQKINELDELMIANNTYDFTNKIVNFIGDSITVGVGSTNNSNGYSTYTSSELHFGTVINNAVGGWLYSHYAGDEYSIAADMTSKIYYDSDILIFYAGVNDYSSSAENKRFGTYSASSKATAGYCGDFEEICYFLKNYYSDREVFFVLNYPVTVTDKGTYQNEAEPHSYYDYIEAQRVIATKYGFNVIDLYSTGLVDGTNAEIAGAYLSDQLHPNDLGHKVLGEHIAAEISYVLGNK